MELNVVMNDTTKRENGTVKSMEHDRPDRHVTSVDEESTNMPEETIPAALIKKVKDYPTFTVFKSKSNPGGKFDLSVSMEEYLELTKKAARSFIKLGLERKCAVSIIGFNHVAWCISQFGCIFGGGIACGIYTTNTADLCKFIINDCNCQIVVVENTIQLTKIISIVDQCPQIKAIIQYTGNIPTELKSKGKVNTYTWKEFLELGSDDQTPELEIRLKCIQPKDTAILIYTSGTTGMPKGVMLSHDNVLYACKMVLSTMDMAPFRHSIVSYLPFSHIAANLFDLISTVKLGVTVYFAQPDALKGSLNNTLQEVRPTLFLGVPRVFEKIQEKIQESTLQLSDFKRCISKWASEVGYRNSMAKQAGKSTDVSYHFANCLVFSKVKRLLGLDRCILIISGAAPIAQQTLDFFLSFDISIHQVYGMSESSGPHTLERFGKKKAGTVGCLIKGVEMKIVNPDENEVGEICMKGRHVFLGYYHAEEKTAEVLDKDGWLHSGDLGKIDEDQFLTVTGRIKELIITAGGENIAPVPIEDKIKEKLPFVSNAILIGDKRKFVSCLLTLKTIFDYETQIPTDKLTPGAIHSLAEIGIEATDVEGVLGSTDLVLKTKVDNAMKEVNSTSVSHAAYVQKWTFLPKDLSIQGGELGPTMKLKRPVIANLYGDIIDRMYI